MSAFLSRHHRPISSEEQCLYNHLLYWVDLESPEQMINRFYQIFIDGCHYTDAEVLAALDQIVLSKLAQDEFRFVLNRCCHILINRWQARSQSQRAIPQLIQKFEQVQKVSTFSIRRSRSVRRLRELTHQFTETEQYLTLRRLVQVVDQEQSEDTLSSRPLGTLIRRYPYLYEHCLLSEDSTLEQQSTVRHLQTSAQRQFEVDLSQYMTYQFRRDRLQSSQTPALPEPNAQVVTVPPRRIIQPVTNPTLLPDAEVRQAIQHYVGRVQGDRTYKDLAQNFLVQSGHSQTFRAFKDDLYEYITQSIDPEYGRRQFNNQLHEHLKSILTDRDSKTLDDFLIVRTCSQLLSFLVVESPQNPKHFVFIDLLNNLGPILTTGLLLKIVLLCRKTKPVLERRFSTLFSHYESCASEAVDWLVRMLENVNVALSAHFGTLNLSFVR